jgi:hypothetical protein
MPNEDQLKAAADEFNKNSEVKIRPFIQDGSLFIEEDKKDWATQAEFVEFVEEAKMKVRGFLFENYGLEV